MKLVYCLILFCLLFSCLPKIARQAAKGSVERHYYVISEKSTWYMGRDTKSTRLPDLLPGDTIATLGQSKESGKWNVIESKGALGYAAYFSTFLTSEELASLKEEQAKAANNLGNGFGFGIGFGTAKALQLEVLYKRNRSMFRAGYGYQFNGQLGKLEGSRLSNYGTTVIGSNTYFIAFLAGYDYWLTDKFAIGVDGCIGTNSAYRNYSDKRFKAGGYHMIIQSELAYGFGGRIDYLASKLIMLSGGYNYLTGANLTVSIVPYGYR